MGLSINALQKMVKKNDSVFVTIITDGMENSSEEYSGKAVKEKVSQCRELGWTFAYIGANQDAVEVANELNIRNALNYEASDKGVKKMSKRVSESLGKCFLAMYKDFDCGDMENIFND